MARIAAYAGALSVGSIDFADAATSAMVRAGDVLVLLAWTPTATAPAGWDSAVAGAGWHVWTRVAERAEEALPTLTVDPAEECAGVVLVYRNASPSYLVSTADESTTLAATSHPTGTVTVVSAQGTLLGAWLGTAGGPEIDPGAMVVVVAQETSGAVAGSARWFVVAESPIASVPTAGPLTVTTSPADDLESVLVVLRDRPPYRPAPLLDSGAGANIGLLP